MKDKKVTKESLIDALEGNLPTDVIDSGIEQDEEASPELKKDVRRKLRLRKKPAVDETAGQPINITAIP
jgi:hypothetical protein